METRKETITNEPFRVELASLRLKYCGSEEFLPDASQYVVERKDEHGVWKRLKGIQRVLVDVSVGQPPKIEIYMVDFPDAL